MSLVFILQPGRPRKRKIEDDEEEKESKKLKETDEGNICTYKPCH